jgi:serine protease
LPPQPRHRRFFSTTTSLLAAAVLGGTFLAAPAAAVDEPELPVVPGSSASADPAPTTDRLIVKFKDTAAPDPAQREDAYDSVADQLDVSVQELRGTATGAQVIEAGRGLDAAETAEVVAELEADPAVEYAEPDLLLRPAAITPDDTYYGQQWGFWEDRAGLGVPRAWDVSYGEGVVVAVVDTGITSHSDLNANVLPGYDMISSASMARDGSGRDSNPQDEGDWDAGDEWCDSWAAANSSWHGTHVAGTIAAVTGNGKGVAGVAPEAKILPVRALGACGGYMSDLADGIIWAAGGTVSGIAANPNPADVINLSLGGTGLCSSTAQTAINLATQAGAAVVVAAGNENQPAANSTPANCRNVITVAASGRDGSRASYSNYGGGVDVTAPGGDWSLAGGIFSTYNTGATAPVSEAYRNMQGTSMAAPHVSGVAALLIAEMGSAATPAAVEKILKETARPLPGLCYEGCGVGLVDAAAALHSVADDYAAPAVSPFRDVLTGQLFYMEMAWLAESGISTGWVAADGSRTYRPFQPISRDAMAAFMYRMAGSPPFAEPAISPFRDVLPGQQFYQEMAWLADAGISTGWAELGGIRSYRPFQPINRDAMAAFMYRFSRL